ncbi:hypothetical protein [Methylobacterium nonmethylotrophicum]|uniref:Uncharacterized protein n=1 Tax=Methylobacterium nonmethylotrophicum TaxID=1141884 RepID=A0A4Z0NIR5_9HYPH|nr:hypothetical protein [Methylobacterium nonmethylotrophicum]TGD96204.1 hypothetical protein EU555_24950 [Methylobacterium nonmethylotrophicum]
MSEVLQFPTRLSSRDLHQIYRLGAIGELEVLLMQPPGDEPAPLEITLRAGSVVVEIASVNDADGDLGNALRSAHSLADVLLSSLMAIKGRGVLRDAFLGPDAIDDGAA